MNYRIQSIRRKHANGKTNIVRSLPYRISSICLQSIDIEGIR